MKEPNKNKDKDAKAKLSKDRSIEPLRSNNICDSTIKSKDEKADGINLKSEEIVEESELSKALKRIKELEESNRQLAQKRITELEEENKKLAQSESKVKRKDKHKNNESHHSRKKTDETKSDKDKSFSRKEVSSNSSRKRKASTASSSSSSIKSPPFPKNESFQSKLKSLGLSDCNESSDENEEEQQAAFQDLFGFKSKKSDKKQCFEKQKEKSKLANSKEENSKDFNFQTEQKPSLLVTNDRDSSSSPNLSDIEERIKVEQEVMQVVAHEAESEKLDKISNHETSEHDQLAAWLGKRI